MTPISRRGFVALGAGIAAGAALPATRAGAATTGTVKDVKHVVILMQENRSFDHYFGRLKGVRGFGDRSGITLSGGQPVFNQPNGLGRQYPWKLSSTPAAGGVDGETLAQCNGDLPHSWSSQHSAWNKGRLDHWVAGVGNVRSLGYLDRGDIPFHYALADNYTVCDAYFSSTLSATGPNRTYLWSGKVDGSSYDGGDESGLTWETYAEALQRAGVSWKVYQNAKDNYGDNGLAYFSKFAGAKPGDPLHDRGMASVPAVTGSTPDDIAAAIKADALAGTLPQVSWVVANQAFSEHPYAPPGDGAHFVDLVHRRPGRIPRGLRLDRPLPQLRRERRLLRPRAAAVASRRHRRRVPRRHPLRPRLPRPDGRHVALDQGRLGLLGGLRPHLRPAVHGDLDDRPRHPGDLPQHQRVAPQGHRRPDRRVRLRPARVRNAVRPARHQGHRVRHLRPAAQPRAADERPAQPGARHPPRARPPVPAERQPRPLRVRRAPARSSRGSPWRTRAPRPRSAAHFSIHPNAYRDTTPWQYTVDAGGTATDFFNIGTGYGGGRVRHHDGRPEPLPAPLHGRRHEGGQGDRGRRPVRRGVRHRQDGHLVQDDQLGLRVGHSSPSRPTTTARTARGPTRSPRAARRRTSSTPWRTRTAGTTSPITSSTDTTWSRRYTGPHRDRRGVRQRLIPRARPPRAIRRVGLSIGGSVGQRSAGSGRPGRPGTGPLTGRPVAG